MKTIRGIDIYFWYEGKMREMASDGCVGRLRIGQALLGISIDSNFSFSPFSVDGKKNVVLRKQKDAPSFCEGKWYEQNINIKLGQFGGVAHTEYNDNNIRLLEIRGDVVGVYEIALVSIEGNFFVTQQCVYSTRCYRNAEEIWSPKFENWPQMLTLLKGLFNGANLPDVSEYKTPEEKTESFASNIGRVLWWNCTQGFGAIQTSEGVARVHYSNVHRPGERLPYLKAGELVTFARLINPSQTQHRATTFKKEAKGIRPFTSL